MLYKKAPKTGIFKLQSTKDKYLQLSAIKGVNLDLMIRFLEIQTVFVCPICPYVAEHGWSSIENVVNRIQK